MNARRPKLPGVLSHIAALVGFPAAIKVAETFGGVKLTGIRCILNGQQHPLIDAIGLEDAITIARELTGEKVEVPKCDDYWRRIRNARICEERAQGATRPELARRYRLTERQITNILGETWTDERQVTLDF